jgi:hypothetical protein
MRVEEVIGAEAAEVTVKEVKGEEQAGEVGIAIEEVEVEVAIKVPDTSTKEQNLSGQRKNKYGPDSSSDAKRSGESR